MLAAADFFAVEVGGPRGPVSFYGFFEIELATGRIDIAGITPDPSESTSSHSGMRPCDNRAYVALPELFARGPGRQ